MDSGTLTCYKNGVSQGVMVTGLTGTIMPAIGDGGGTGLAQDVFNFGQDSSFAGNKTPQGNQDSGGIGDFYYAPPTGFLALCTANLPDPDVIPSEHFNTVLYTGNGSTQTIDTEIQNDLTWLKNRSISSGHYIWDSVRTFGDNELSSSTTNAEGANAAYYTITKNATGFDIMQTGGGNEVNYLNYLHATWNWKAGGSAVSNTNGSITSSVSANPSAGTTTNYWGTSVPSSTVFGLWASGGDNNTNGATQIAYAFHSVDGHSKVGSYIGNGNADGPFVHCGFKPAMIIFKVSSASGTNWMLLDNKRDPFNDDTPLYLHPDTNDADNANSGAPVDFVSNGFKVRTASSIRNPNGGTVIFIAFAENPSKHTNAR